MTPPDAPTADDRSPARRRVALVAGIAGGVLLVAALAARVVSTDPEQFVFAHRALFRNGAAAAWALAFAFASPLGRRRAAAVALSVGVSLVALEAVLRVLAGPYYAPVFRLNDTWLFEHIPGARKINSFRTPHGVDRVPFDVNSDGFRGPELRAPGAAKRVVVYGDSFIAAYATMREETYVEQLGVELRSALRADVEMVNAGVIGYGPDQVCLRMEADLPRLRADLVVVAVSAENDYGDLVRDRLFELGPDRKIARRRATISQATRDAYAQAQSGLLVGRLFVIGEERLAASLQTPANAAPQAADELGWELAMCRSEYEEAVTNRRAEAMLEYPDHPDADVRLEPSSPSALHKVDLMAETLLAIRDAAKARGVPLLLLVVPSAPDVCRGYDTDAADTARFPQYRPDNLTRPIERAADAYAIPYLGLFGPFTATDANALYAHGGDTHWNPAGQALAAKLTARAIVERRLLP